MKGKIIYKKTRPMIIVLITALIVMVYASIVEARNYAVLVSAEQSDRNDWEYNSEFWYDLFLMYETLIDYGYTHENIYVLYGDSSDSDYTFYGRYDASEEHPEWGITQITDYPNDKEYVDSVFTWFAEGSAFRGITKMTEHDRLFVWWKGHGTGEGSLTLWIDIGTEEEEHISDVEFAGYIDQITEYRSMVFWFGTCYSGGIIYELAEYGTVHTSCNYDQEAYCINRDPGGNWDTYHGIFFYYYNCALQWQTPDGNSVNADNDEENGLISLWEAFDYTTSKLAYNRCYEPGEGRWYMDPQKNDWGYQTYLFSCGRITRETRFDCNMYFPGDVIVDEDATLTINPWVTITFDANHDDYDGGMGEYGSNLCELLVEGELVAAGTGSRYIDFQSTEEDCPGAWYGIVLKNASAHIKCCKIKNAKYGIYSMNTDDVTIEYSDIIETSGVGIYLSNSSPTISDNNIEYHNAPVGQGTGIVCYYYSAPIIRHNHIAYNSTYGLKCTVLANPKLIGVGDNENERYGANIIESNTSDEVYVNYNSTANLGLSSPEKYKGKNTIQDGSGYLVRNTNSSQIVSAECNYWGGTPSSSRFMNVDYDPCESSAYTGAGPRSPLGKRLVNSGQLPDIGASSLSKVNENSGIEGFDAARKYMALALKYELDGDLEKAVETYRYVVDNYPESDYSFCCLLSIMTCRSKQGKEDLELAYLQLKEKEHQGKKIGKLATLLIPNSLVVGGHPQAAIAKCSETIELYKESDENMVKQALFEIGHIHLFTMKNKTDARQAFMELANRYPTDELLEDANLLLDASGCDRLGKKIPQQEYSESLVLDYSLFQNFPNPANPTTTINFELPEATYVTLEIYNLLGQKVRMLVQGTKEAGSHAVAWDGRDGFGKVVSSGIYLYHLKCHLPNSRPGSKADFVQVKKLLLIR